MLRLKVLGIRLKMAGQIQPPSGQQKNKKAGLPVRPASSVKTELPQLFHGHILKIVGDDFLS